MGKEKLRDSNIELLRIFTMLGVIILHYNYADAGGGFRLVTPGSINYYLMYVLQSMSIAAVDLFILISGYFMCTSCKRGIFKPLTLVAQVIVFRVLICIASGILHGGISLRGIVSALIPRNYFVILYVVLYLISPYLNLLLHAMDQKEMRRMMLILLLLFSLEPTLVDLMSEVTGSEQNELSAVGRYGSQWGYCIVNFVLMYLVGAYLRLHPEKTDKIPTGKLCAGFGLFLAADVCWSLLNNHMTRFASRSAYEYCNPLVICSAATLFLLFRRMQIKPNRIINSLAKGSFTVYLLHGVLLQFLRIEKFVNKNPLIYLLHVLLGAALIYLVCWTVYVCYDFVTSRLYRLLQSKVHFYEYEVKPAEAKS